MHPEHACTVPGALGADGCERMQRGFDHSYYFIASFIGEHIAHHARALHG